MQIVSHRGYWLDKNEQNSFVAFERALACGFGIETDLRDHDGQLVIAHDLPDDHAMPADEVFRLCGLYGREQILALNIKADGLQALIEEKVAKYSLGRYFCFDMSVPDALGCIKQGLKVYTRQSEYERDPSFYHEAHGVWMDAFHDDWIRSNDIEYHLMRGKEVCIVSPELHKRDSTIMWKRLREMNLPDQIGLCTDFPDKAREYFHG